MVFLLNQKLNLWRQVKGYKEGGRRPQTGKDFSKFSMIFFSDLLSCHFGAEMYSNLTPGLMISNDFFFTRAGSGRKRGAEFLYIRG